MASVVQKKICLLGAFAVGKTSLVLRYVSSMFGEKYHTTVGVKIDKKQLPNSAGIGLKSGLEYVAPTSEIEKQKRDETHFRRPAGGETIDRRTGAGLRVGAPSCPRLQR